VPISTNFSIEKGGMPVERGNQGKGGTRNFKEKIGPVLGQLGGVGKGEGAKGAQRNNEGGGERKMQSKFKGEKEDRSREGEKRDIRFRTENGLFTQLQEMGGGSSGKVAATGEREKETCRRKGLQVLHHGEGCQSAGKKKKKKTGGNLPNQRQKQSHGGRESARLIARKSGVTIREEKEL